MSETFTLGDKVHGTLDDGTPFTGYIGAVDWQDPHTTTGLGVFFYGDVVVCGDFADGIHLRIAPDGSGHVMPFGTVLRDDAAVTP